MKIWGGRFKGDTDMEANDFNSSVHFDARLYKEDIRGSVEHARMLSHQGIITPDEARKIIDGLEKILEGIACGEITLSAEAEDIHMNVEKLLTEKIGETGKKLHTARSRNDQVALDLRMYLKSELGEISRLVKDLCGVLIGIAKTNLNTIMPGYTHLQKAQPVTLAHHMMAYVFMFIRDLERMNDTLKRTDVMPLGSGALAGTTYPIDRKYLQKNLGFAGITHNSIDAVSDRDFCVEAAFSLSVIMMHMSRFGEETVLWSSEEFSFITLDDAFSTGSSMMPQKKNPDIAELVRGKTGRVYGNLFSLLTMMKGLPLAYNKDMQEDKEAIFDSLDTVKQSLSVFSKMLSTAKFNRETMYRAARKGYLNATDLADYLVQKGASFRDAHETAGKVVAHCIDHGKTIEELHPDELKSFSSLISNDVYDKISLENCVYNRDTEGGPAPARVLESIGTASEMLRKLQGV